MAKNLLDLLIDALTGAESEYEFEQRQQIAERKVKQTEGHSDYIFDVTYHEETDTYTDKFGRECNKYGERY